MSSDCRGVIEFLNQHAKCSDFTFQGNSLEFTYTVSAFRNEPQHVKLVLVRLSADFYQGKVMIAWTNKPNNTYGVQPMTLFHPSTIPDQTTWMATYGMDFNAGRHLNSLFVQLMPLFVHATDCFAD